jgi:hypothetical protein
MFTQFWNYWTWGEDALREIQEWILEKKVKQAVITAETRREVLRFAPSRGSFSFGV